MFFMEIIYWFGNRKTPRDAVPLLCVSFCARLFIILISMGKNWNNVLNLITANVNGARGMLTVSIISCTLHANYINMQ